MKVPLLDLNAIHLPLHKEIMNAIEKVVNENAFILGPEVEKLEKAVAIFTGVKEAIGVSSGTDALLLALMALGVKSGDEVITTPYSFFATAGAIARLGARPVFVDIDPRTYNINPSGIEQKITKRTKAIIPVHLYGQCADMEPIVSLGRQFKIPIVEDAAQAIGSEYLNGRRAGSIGDIGCFSFFPSKNLGAMGDGGMVVTNNSELAEHMRILRVHGSKPKYVHKFIGGNFRLDALQAAILNVKLPHLDRWTHQRQGNALRYADLFREGDLVKHRQVELPYEAYADKKVREHHIYNQFVIRVKNRDGLLSHLKDKGIGAEVYYPIPLHLQDCFLAHGYKAGDFPESERAAKETLALPIYPELTMEMQQFVVNIIESYFKSKT